MRSLPAFLKAVGVGQAAIWPLGRHRAPATALGRPPRRRLGAYNLDAIVALVDLAGRAQVKAGEHAQRRSVLIGCADGSERVRHGAGHLGDHGRVLCVSLGGPRR